MGSFAFVSFEFGIVTDRQHRFPAVGILINGAAAVTDGRIVMEFGIVADGAGCALIVISAALHGGSVADKRHVVADYGRAGGVNGRNGTADGTGIAVENDAVGNGQFSRIEDCAALEFTVVICRHFGIDGFFFPRRNDQSFRAGVGNRKSCSNQRCCKQKSVFHISVP